MIFAHTLALVLAGAKTQTRRTVRQGEKLTERDGTVSIETAAGRVKFMVGRTYAVQPGRGQRAMARIRLTGIRREPVAAISEADAQAEGFASRAAFLDTWRVIHGANADPDAPVWVLKFVLSS